MSSNDKSQWPQYDKEQIEAVGKIIASGKVNYWTGEECRKFETEFAQWTDTKHAVAVMNGTVALDLAFVALGIGVGDEVIVTSRTFLASVSSIINTGATPVFADVDRDSQNITAETISAALTDKTKAILCVHLAGWPCDMDPIMELAAKHDIYVVEDCAQAHGAKYKGKPVGGIGHIGAWSFCQDKIMTTGGEGGMVTTNNENWWEKMWAYKDHGKSYDTVYNKSHPPGFRWLHESFGTNWRMLEMQGAIGRIQLKRMKSWHDNRLNNAKKIWETAKKCKALRTPEIPSNIEHAAYKCYVFIDLEALNPEWDREKIITEINSNGVMCLGGSCSEVYLEKAFDNTDLRPKSRLPIAQELGETALMFLVHPTLTEVEIGKTCEVLTSVMDKAIKVAT